MRHHMKPCLNMPRCVVTSTTIPQVQYCLSLVYIVMYFVLTRAALREVASAMKASMCEERGALGFVTDGFLDARILPT